MLVDFMYAQLQRPHQIYVPICRLPAKNPVLYTSDSYTPFRYHKQQPNYILAIHPSVKNKILTGKIYVDMTWHDKLQFGIDR